MSWSDLQFQAFSVDVAGTHRGLAPSMQVPNDSYLYIHQFSILSTDINGQVVGLYLLDPQVGIALPPAAFDPATWEKNFIGHIMRLSRGGQVGGQSLGDNTVQQNSATPHAYNCGLIIPSNFYVAAIEENGVLSALDHKLVLNLLYLQIQKGCQPPLL